MIHFVNPWGLLALLAIPLILLIHLFRRKFPQRRVAGLFLWSGARREVPPGLLRDRLPYSWSLLLELLAALLLALLLAQPRFSVGFVPYLVVVLDDSASMTARAANGETVRRRALRKLESRVEEMGSNTLLTILTTGKRPAVLVGPSLPWNDALSELSRWRPSATTHDPTPALDLAIQLAKDNAPILFLTDGPIAKSAQLPTEVEVIALGEPVPNLAFASARWWIDPDRSTGGILGHLSNFADQPAEATLVGSASGVEYFTQTLTIPAGQTHAFRADVPLGIGPLILEVHTGSDSLELDSRLELVEPPPRIVPVANSLPANHPASDSVERLLEAFPEVERAEQADAFLEIVEDSPAVTPNQSAWRLILSRRNAAPDDEAGQLPADRRSIVIDPQVPLLAGVTFQGLGLEDLSEANGEGVPLATLGGLPIVTRYPAIYPPSFGLHINFNRSQFINSPDWPIFFSNLVTLARDDLPGPRRSNYRLGEGITFRLPENANPNDVPLRLTGLNTSRQISHAEIISIAPPQQPGIYRLHAGETSLAQFAVNFFAPKESDIRSRDTFAQDPARQGDRGTRVDSLESWPVSLALCIVILVLLINWYLLGRSTKVNDVRPLNHSIPSPSAI